MILYLDTSAWVKLYVRESGSKELRAYTAKARSAGDRAEVCGVPGFDSIHLASALWLKEKTSMPLRFVAFDQCLRAAAERAGLPVVPRCSYRPPEGARGDD